MLRPHNRTLKFMIDQCQSVCKMGIRACALDYNCTHAQTSATDSGSNDSETVTEDISTSVSLEDIVRGKYQVFYAHPDALLQTKRGERLLNRLSTSNQLACVAVDEANMILKWQVFFNCNMSAISLQYHQPEE